MRQFSAALAHELRTPLAGLRGHIELAMRAPGNDRVQRDAFASQLEELDRLTRLINHVLTLARAESGQIRLAVSRVDLGQLVPALVEQLEVVAESQSLDLHYEHDAAAVFVNGDAGWLERMVLNLVDNAMKYSNPPARVVVRVGRDHGHARLTVQDFGVGLSPDEARRVFDRFFRADPARSRSSDGAGLGLSLVQWVATAHGGTVAVQSTLGEGSTFTVTLPLSRAAEAS
jgi:signal transduction histidine kinase